MLMPLEACEVCENLPETWPVQNENTCIQYPVWFSNTEVSVSVYNLKNTE